MFRKTPMGLWALWVLFSVGLSKVSFGAEAGQELTFTQTLRLALDESPLIQSAKRAEQKAQLAQANAKSAFLPKLDLSASHQYYDQDREATGFNTSGDGRFDSDSPWGHQLRFQLSETLYDNGENLRRLRTRSLESTLADLQSQLTRNQVLRDVAKAYYDFSLESALTAASEQQVSVLREQFRTIQTRFQRGVTSSRDFLRIKSQVERAEMSLLSQKLQQEQSLLQLRTLLGTSAQQKRYRFVPLVADTPPTVSELAPETALEFQIASLQNQVSDLQVQSVAAEYGPRLSLRAESQYTFPQYLDGGGDDNAKPYWSWGAFLALDYNLWDWHQRRRDKEMAEHQRSMDRYQREHQLLKVREDISLVMARINQLRESFALSQKILRTDEQAYRIVNEGYRNGKVNYLDLVSALTDLYGSRISAVTLQFQLLKTTVDWRYYRGQIYAEILAR